MTAHFRVLAIGALFSCLLSPALRAEDEPQEEPNPAAEEFAMMLRSIDWTTSGSGDLGGMATLAIPDGCRFTETPGAVRILEAQGNLPNGGELGFAGPDDMSWFAVFKFDDCGYVNDDERGKLDADGILKQMRENQQEANRRLKEQGRPMLEVLGWQKPPFYNPQTNNLEWAVRLASEGGWEIVNYRTKLLGRRGVMDVVLVCSEEQLESAVPEYQKLLGGFAFKQEESYASFTKGDKVAQYGLTGLIVGGGLLVAAKSGLLAKLWKPLVLVFVAIGAFLKRIFTGRTQKQI